MLQFVLDIPILQLLSLVEQNSSITDINHLNKSSSDSVVILRHVNGGSLGKHLHSLFLILLMLLSDFSMRMSVLWFSLFVNRIGT